MTCQSCGNGKAFDAYDIGGYVDAPPNKLFKKPYELPDYGSPFAIDPQATCNGGVPFTVTDSSTPGTCSGIAVGTTCIDQNMLIIGGVATATVIGLAAVFLIRRRNGGSRRGGR